MHRRNFFASLFAPLIARCMPAARETNGLSAFPSRPARERSIVIRGVLSAVELRIDGRGRTWQVLPDYTTVDDRPAPGALDEIEAKVGDVVNVPAIRPHFMDGLPEPGLGNVAYIRTA